LTSVIQSDCPEWVLGDSTRIQQILTNLFSNAFKFTQEGSIDLTVSKVKDVDRNHVLIRYLIKDSGIGIHESKISGLFMPFRQADSSTTRNYGGTGLGLSISKQLTELMGGVVGVKSEEGDGSSFWIDVPFKVESPPVESLKSKEIEKNLLLGKSILLIGDAEIFQSQFVELCAVYNIQSAEVLTGREGLALLEKSMHDNKAIDAIFVSFLNVSNIDLTFLNEISLLTKDHSCPLVLLDFPKSICSSLTTVPCLFIDTPITNGHLLAEILDLFGGSITTDVESPSQQESKYSRIRVLVAEDNAVNQIVILGILDKLGVQSILAENGQQAVDFCSSGTDDVFDLILMDCEMPVMDGWVATKVIRQNDYLGSNCKPVLIYALSAHTKDKFLDEAMDSGMNGYLFKPIVVAQLVEILDNILLKSFR
jgi:CheY-like chemotaxis protein